MSRLLVAAALAAATLSPALAHKPLKPKELAVLDPTKGYILVRVGPGSAKETPIGVALARLDPVEQEPIVGNGLSKKEFNVASVAGGNFISSDGKTRLYLVPVNPGRWIFTGVGMTTFSMGTYGFDVRAGEIVNAGTVLVGREDGKSAIPDIAATKLSQDLVEFGTLTNIVMTDTYLIRPASATETLPASVKLPVRDAEYQSDIRFKNVYGLMVNRAIGLPPMQHNAPRPSSAPSAGPTATP
jgi:hypothetical protein